MIGIDGITLAYRNIKARKARSFLTLLGIAVGIAAIISLISIGQGMEYAIVGEMVGMADIISVIPGQIIPGRGYVPLGAFTERDVEDVRRIDGVKEALGWAMGIVEVEHRREIIPIELTGGDPRDIETMWGPFVDLEDGRWLHERDHRGVMIGYMVATDYFEEEIGAGDRIDINGERIVVVGIMRGGALAAEVDHMVLAIPETARNILGTDDIMYMVVRVYDIDRAEEIADEIEEKIDENHKLEEFATAMTVGAAIGMIGTVLGILSAVLAGIASIALVVGCIGIINSMLMSVMERTHEIGIMKAVGATNNDILFLFLMEAGMISLVGGVLGVILGIVVAKVIGMGVGMAIGMEMPLILVPEVMIGGLIIAISVGVAAGLYPARKASKMSPVEAVRYE
ncbi:MAG: putative ABC transporter permease YknZ [Syntrophomonadaceae bacterium]|nr:putative ABC transporter permease YknZ [Bacillota bacterium]